MTSTSDEDLLAAADGDAAAFAAFYRRHAPAVLAWFFKRTGQRELAADLTAETFAAALEGCHRYRPDRGPAVAWLFGIAHHRLARLAERGTVERRALRRLRMTRPELDDAELQRVVAAAGDPVLDAALAALPDEQRTAVLARVVDERSYEEIAAATGSSAVAVRQRVSRGLLALRRRLTTDPQELDR